MTPDELAHLRRARDLMDREYARPLDVPAMAKAALMSPSQFARRFRDAYGETPYAYLMCRRIERAMALLRRGDLSVTEVCLAVGCDLARLVQLAVQRAGRGEPQRLPGPRPPSGVGGARLRRTGVVAARAQSGRNGEAAPRRTALA